MDTANKIKEYRKNKGMTQAEVAKKAGISEISIRKYESGERKPKLETIRKIAAALDVHIGSLTENWAEFSQEEIKKDLILNNKSRPLNALIPEPIQTQSATEKILLKMIRELNDNGKYEAFKLIDSLRQLDQYTNKDTDFKPYEDMLQSQHSSQESDATTEKTATTSTSETATDISEIITDNQ